MLLLQPVELVFLAVHEKETDPIDKCACFEREPGADDDIDEGGK
jgi:hypothetical protein